MSLHDQPCLVNTLNSIFIPIFIQRYFDRNKESDVKTRDTMLVPSIIFSLQKLDSNQTSIVQLKRQLRLRPWKPYTYRDNFGSLATSCIGELS